MDAMNMQYNSSLLLNMAIAHQKLGQHYHALNSLNKAIQYNPKYVKALVKRGDINIILSNYYEAINDFNEAIQFQIVAESTQSGVGVEQIK